MKHQSSFRPMDKQQREELVVSHPKGLMNKRTYVKIVELHGMEREKAEKRNSDSRLLSHI